MCDYIFPDDFQDDVGPVPLKKTKSTAKAKVKAKEEAKSKEPVTLKRKERYMSQQIILRWKLIRIYPIQ